MKAVKPVHLSVGACLLACLACVGCGSSTPTQPQEVAPAIVLPPAERPTAKPTEKAVASIPPEPKGPRVVLPTDAGGRAVAKAFVMPPPLPEANEPTMTPAPEIPSANDRGEVAHSELLLKPFHTPWLRQSGETLPAPPTEPQLPCPWVETLPDGKIGVRPRVKADSPKNARAIDVPMNGWQQRERTNLSDPTDDLSAVGCIETDFPNRLPNLPLLPTSPEKNQLETTNPEGEDLGTLPVK